MLEPIEVDIEQTNRCRVAGFGKCSLECIDGTATVEQSGERIVHGLMSQLPVEAGVGVVDAEQQLVFAGQCGDEVLGAPLEADGLDGAAVRDSVNRGGEDEIGQGHQSDAHQMIVLGDHKRDGAGEEQRKLEGQKQVGTRDGEQHCERAGTEGEHREEQQQFGVVRVGHEQGASPCRADHSGRQTNERQRPQSGAAARAFEPVALERKQRE